MLVVRVELLHGAFHAAGEGDLTLTGSAAAEWPPSPARLFQALVAADGTGDQCRVTPGALGLDLLERADPPEIRAVAAGQAPISRLRGRFAVVDRTDTGSVQEYPARTAQQVRPGARVFPAVPQVAYVWPQVDPNAQQLSALQARAARVGYLGMADTPVRVRVGTDPSQVPEGLPIWHPDTGGDVHLPVPFPGFLDSLDAAFADWTEGNPRRSSWTSRRLSAYRSPGRRPEPEWPSGTAVWLRFDRAVRGRRVVAVAETVRAALLEHAERAVGSRDAVPQVLHGHHADGARGVEHCRVLPLPDAGFRHSDGWIHGVCVWLPPGTGEADLDLARSALAAVRRLVRPGQFDIAVAAFDGTRVPWSSNPARWIGPARRWVSVFPVVFERRLRGGLTLTELARWCSWAGLPEPVAFQAATVPLMPGAVSLTPLEAAHGVDRRPFTHLDLTFAQPVTGPVALGRGRHFGLGLMAPRDEHHPGGNEHD